MWEVKNTNSLYNNIHGQIVIWFTMYENNIFKSCFLPYFNQTCLSSIMVQSRHLLHNILLTPSINCKSYYVIHQTDSNSYQRSWRRPRQQLLPYFLALFQRRPCCSRASSRPRGTTRSTTSDRTWSPTARRRGNSKWRDSIPQLWLTLTTSSATSVKL